MGSSDEGAALAATLADALRGGDAAALSAALGAATSGPLARRERVASALLLRAASEDDDVFDAVAARLYGGIGGPSSAAADAVCAWLYDWTQAGSAGLRASVLCAVPALLWVSSSSSSAAAADACLLGLRAAAAEDAAAGALPAFSLPPPGGAHSVYSSSQQQQQQMGGVGIGGISQQKTQLTAAALRSHDSRQQKSTTPSLQQQQQQLRGRDDVVDAVGRQALLRSAVTQINAALPLLPVSVRSRFCAVVARIAAPQFGAFADAVPSSSECFPGVNPAQAAQLAEHFPQAVAAATSRRTPPSAELLVECISGLAVCCRVRELRDGVLRACKAIEATAAYACQPQPLLAARALQHTVQRLDDEDASLGNPRISAAVSVPLSSAAAPLPSIKKRSADPTASSKSSSDDEEDESTESGDDGSEASGDA